MTRKHDGLIRKGQQLFPDGTQQCLKITAGKVRATLIENEHILDAFIGETIVLHVPSAYKLPEAFVREVLKDAKLAFETIEKNKARLF